MPCSPDTHRHTMQFPPRLRGRFPTPMRPVCASHRNHPRDDYKSAEDWERSEEFVSQRGEERVMLRMIKAVRLVGGKSCRFPASHPETARIGGVLLLAAGFFLFSIQCGW